jgi:hypothetical protein
MILCTLQSGLDSRCMTLVGLRNSGEDARPDISMPDVCETPDNVGKYDEGERRYAENDTYHRLRTGAMVY